MTLYCAGLQKVTFRKTVLKKLKEKTLKTECEGVNYIRLSENRSSDEMIMDLLVLYPLVRVHGWLGKLSQSFQAFENSPANCSCLFSSVYLYIALRFIFYFNKEQEAWILHAAFYTYLNVVLLRWNSCYLCRLSFPQFISHYFHYEWKFTMAVIFILWTFSSKFLTKETDRFVAVTCCVSRQKSHAAHLFLYSRTLLQYLNTRFVK